LSKAKYYKYSSYSYPYCNLVTKHIYKYYRKGLCYRKSYA